MAKQREVPLSQEQILRFAIKFIIQEIDLCSEDIREGKRVEAEKDILFEKLSTLKTLYRLETGREYSSRHGH